MNIAKFQLINETVKRLNDGRPYFAKITKEQVEQVISCYEAAMFDSLQKVDEYNPVTVKPFSGVQITATYQPNQDVIMYGKVVKSAARYNLKAKVSKYLRDTFNNSLDF